jgi:hypothetical protein
MFVECGNSWFKTFTENYSPPPILQFWYKIGIISQWTQKCYIFLFNSGAKLDMHSKQRVYVCQGQTSEIHRCVFHILGWFNWRGAKTTPPRGNERTHKKVIKFKARCCHAFFHNIYIGAVRPWKKAHACARLWKV